jgi:hypothetical protein
MIQIKPTINYQSSCPNCGGLLVPKDILWQGIHVCVDTLCGNCQSNILGDLNIGHAIHYPYKVDMQKGQIFGPAPAMVWFGSPLLKSLQNPQLTTGTLLSVEILKKSDKVIILNCLDYLYGHSLLKLLNAGAHLNSHTSYGLVVLVQKFLRWMVPSSPAEIWTADIPLSQAQIYIER